MRRGCRGSGRQALAQARPAAGDGDVAIQGGATTINQYLAAGLVDELRLHIVPLTLGADTRLFEGVPLLKLERMKRADSRRHDAARATRGRTTEDGNPARLAQRAGIKTVARSASRSFRSPTLNKSPKSANCSLKTQIPPQSSGGPSRRPPVQRG